MSSAVSVIAIPALTGVDHTNNPNEILRINESQLAWIGKKFHLLWRFISFSIQFSSPPLSHSHSHSLFLSFFVSGSIVFIFQAIGCIFSGLLAGPMGRKKAMLMVNIPHILGWIILHSATSVSQIFTSFMLFGLGNGLMESPVITYVGEISLVVVDSLSTVWKIKWLPTFREPSIRGTLTACSSVSCSLGAFIVILLGSLMPWRSVALTCTCVPIITLLLIVFVSELLSDNERMVIVKHNRIWLIKNSIYRFLKHRCGFYRNTVQQTR